ncbi:hypothetical protein JHK85_010488 [Glycine max]|nr:hypothetical protein JHK85_010488 [Glycine max]
MERNNEGKWALIQAHSVSRHGLTTASLRSCCRLCRDFASCQDQSGTPLSSSPTTPPSTPPGGSADQCGGPLPPLREAQLLRRHLQQHRPPRPPPPRAHRRPRRPSFFLFFRTPFLSFSSIANAPLVVAVVRGFVDFGKGSVEPQPKVIIQFVFGDAGLAFLVLFVFGSFGLVFLGCDWCIGDAGAGRLRSVDDHTHKLEVDCNGEGVVFAEAFMARVLVYYSPSHNTAAISIRVRVGVRTSSHSSWCSSSSTCWSSSLSSQQFPFEFVFVTVAFSFVFTVTLDLSSTGPLRVCVYSDPGAHLSVKFPSKFENDLLKDTGWYYKELLEKCGWNGIVEVIEAKGEGDMFHLLNLDCDNAVSLLDRVASFINHS